MNSKIPEKSYKVEFIKSISSRNDIIKEKSIGEKIIEWIFGEENKFLFRPMSVCEVNGIIYVLDQGGGYIARIDTLECEFDLILNNSDQIFPSLLSITLDGKGNLLFTDSRENKVYLFITKEEIIKPFLSNYELNQPTGIAYNKKTKEVWVVETKRHSIAIFNEKGEYLKSVGKRGTNSGEFNFPTYICIDNEGLIYVVDSGNFRIQILNSLGEVLKIFGEPGDATGYFARPKGIALDTNGHIFIVDGLYNSIQVFDSSGNFLYYFGAKGSSDGQFWLPTGIFIDQNNIIYVADSYNSRVQIFKLVENEEN